MKDGRFLDVNVAFEGRYGYSRTELIGHTVHELRIWEDPADRLLMLTQLQKGIPIRNAIARLRTNVGELKLTTYSANRIHYDGQDRVLAISEDVPLYEPQKANWRLL